MIGFEQLSNYSRFSDDKQKLVIGGFEKRIHKGIGEQEALALSPAERKKIPSCVLLATYNSYVTQKYKGVYKCVGDVIALIDTSAFSPLFAMFLQRGMGNECKCSVALEDKIELEVEDRSPKEMIEYSGEDTLLMHLYLSCSSLLDKSAIVYSEHNIHKNVSYFFKEARHPASFNEVWDNVAIIFDNGKFDIEKLVECKRPFILCRRYPSLVSGAYQRYHYYSGWYIVYCWLDVSDRYGEKVESLHQFTDNLSPDEVYYVASEESYNYMKYVEEVGFPTKVVTSPNIQNSQLQNVENNPTVGFVERNYNPFLPNLISFRDGKKRASYYVGYLEFGDNYVYEGSSIRVYNMDKVGAILGSDGRYYKYATTSFSFFRNGKTQKGWVRVNVVSTDISYKKFLTAIRLKAYDKLDKFKRLH